MNPIAGSKANAAEPWASWSVEDALRGDTYGLLGSLLAKPPRTDFLRQLAVIEPDSSPASNDSLPAAWRALAAAAKDATAGAVDAEYHDLFIGLGRGELMPYGSWYRTGYLMEQPLAYLRQDLRELGIARREDVKEPEDHAGALLESMRVMITQGIDERRQQRFFNAHIEPWMARFFRDLNQARNARFYRAVGTLGDRFLDVERQYLAMLSQ